MSDTLGDNSGEYCEEKVRDTSNSNNSSITIDSTSSSTPMGNKNNRLIRHKKNTLYSCHLVTNKKKQTRRRTKKRALQQQSSIRKFFTTTQLPTTKNVFSQDTQKDLSISNDNKKDQHLSESEIHQRAQQVQTTLESTVGDKLDLELNNNVF